MSMCAPKDTFQTRAYKNEQTGRGKKETRKAAVMDLYMTRLFDWSLWKVDSILFSLPSPFLPLLNSCSLVTFTLSPK